MSARMSPTVRRRRLGIELRRLRDAAGLTIEQVAERLLVSDSKISRIETGKVPATQRDVRDLLALYGVEDQQQDVLMRMAGEARQKSWWHQYGEALDFIEPLVGLEAAAASIRQFEGQFVPGLFQTVEYAREIFRTLRPDLGPEAVDERVRLRMKRQDLLTRSDAPVPMVWAVLDEGVLRRSVGGVEVMREQLNRLIEVAALPNVTVQVLPFSVGAHIGMAGSFTILGFADEADPDVVYLEGHTAAQLLESHDDLRSYEQAFNNLHVAAHEPAASIAVITEMVKTE